MWRKLFSFCQTLKAITPVFNPSCVQSMKQTFSIRTQQPYRPPVWLSGERVGLMTWWFDTRLKRTFFQAYFRFSHLLKHVRKVVGGFGKKSCVSTSVREPGSTWASQTAMT